MRQFLLIQALLLTFLHSQTDGEVVKNVTGAQRTDGSKILDIYYDLEESDTFSSYTVYVQLEWPDVDHAFYLTHCGGDVWFDVQPGENKYITCELGMGVEDQFLSGEFYINIIAQSSAVSENPFEMVTINASDQTELFNYDYEMMKTEVTAAEYVQFLNDHLATATSVFNYDSDYWTDIEGGEIFNRYYVFDTYIIRIYYDVEGQSGWIKVGQGISENGEWLISIDRPLPIDQTEMFEHGNMLSLSKVYDDDEYAKIQFSSTAAGSDDFSFFISPGKGNHPILNIWPMGAEIFASYYGLRIPTMNEYKLPIWNEYNEDGQLVDMLNGNLDFETFINTHPLQDFYITTWQGQPEFSNIPNTTMPVEDGYEYSNGLISLLSNGTEYVYALLSTDPVIDSFALRIARGFGVMQNNYDPFFGDWNMEGGFRCARTIPGSYTGNNE